MTRKQHWLPGCGILGVFVAAAGGAEPQGKPAAAEAKPDVAAYVGNEVITLQELDAKALKTNMKLAQSLYDARRAALDQIVLERLLGPDAKAKGTTVDQVIRDRITEKATPVTDADVQAYYDSNKARMGTRTLEQVSAQIRAQLTSQRESEAKTNLLTELKEKAGVKVVLAPPRVDMVVASNDPFKGSANAKVTIVEYSDFQ
jgi:hypothetical protein